MSIIWIIILAFLAALLIFALAGLIVCVLNEYDYDDTAEKALIVITTVCIFLWPIFTCIGVATNTECHEIWIAEYEAQKMTIEASIESENLSGLERIELVNRASELNGELAARKTEVSFWHHVTFGDVEMRYNNLEPIQIK